MKICVICLTNLTFDNRDVAKNIRSYEISAICHMLKDQGNHVDLIVKKCRNNVDCPFAIDISEWNEADYDAIYIYNGRLNFYGGIPPQGTIKAFCKFSNYKGKVYYILTDPSLIETDPSDYLFDRIQSYLNKHASDNNDLISDCKELTKEVIDNCHELFKHMTVLSCWDYNKIVETKTKSIVKPLNQKDFNINKYESKLFFKDRENLDIDKLYDSKEYDLVYYGNNRATGRNRIIVRYLDNTSINSIIVGFDSSKLNFKKVTLPYIEYKPKSELYDYVDEKCLATIIIGDPLANGYGISLRFYEGLLLNSVMFITKEYDPDKKLISNNELGNFIYIDSSDELSEKIKQLKSDKELFKHIIKLQKDEFNNRPF